ncbi:MFS transporter [Corynebacterium variabile]|uniref:MFS transporter n=1 Tax=Corynebacterium variabile TaxID=1727 RepID=UPI003FD21B60
MDRIGRKPLLVWTFAIVAVIWGVVGVIQSSPVALVFAAICAFAFFNGAANFLQIVYPNELFPTEVRATAVGVGTAVSRIGSAIATYAMPFALDAGISSVLLVGAAVSVVGLGATLAWGEETNGKSLSASASQIPAARTAA